jgi:hypothetical protein
LFAVLGNFCARRSRRDASGTGVARAFGGVVGLFVLAAWVEFNFKGIDLILLGGPSFVCGCWVLLRSKGAGRDAGGTKPKFKIVDLIWLGAAVVGVGLW